MKKTVSFPENRTNVLFFFIKNMMPENAGYGIGAFMRSYPTFGGMRGNEKN